MTQEEDNVFISSAKKNEIVENFAKSKREELEKMIPNFVDDRKFTDIVLNFYERGIRDGAQMMQERMEALEEAVDAEIVEVEDNNNSMYAYTHLEICTDEDLSKVCKAGDKAKVIIIKQNSYESSAM